MPRHIPLLLAIVASTVTPAARAQSAEESATGQALFDKGRELLGQGKNEEACPILEESQRVDPAPGTQYWLATCYERVGKLASAWSLFLELAASEKAAGNADRAEAARTEAEKLKARLPQLVLEVESPVLDLKVERNGKEISQAQFGLAVPVDGGEHTIRASAPGYEPHSSTVLIDQEAKTTTVVIPELTPAPNEPAKPDHETAEAAPARDAAGLRVLLSADLSVSVGVAALDYYGYTASAGLFAVGPQVTGGVVLENGLTFASRALVSYQTLFGGASGSIGTWGLQALGGYTFRQAGSEHFQVLLGGVGFEHFPSASAIHPALSLTYTYSLGALSFGADMRVVMAPFEKDYLFGIHIGYAGLL